MAIPVFDSTGAVSTAVDSTDTHGAVNVAHTVTGGQSNVCLVAVVTWIQNAGGDAENTVTFNSTPMTRVSHNFNSVSFDIGVDVFVLANPDAGSEYTCAVTLGNACIASSVSVFAFSGVDQSTPVNTFDGYNNNSNSSPTVTLTTTAADCMIVTGACIQGEDCSPAGADNGETEIEDDVTGGGSSTADIAFWVGYLGKSATGDQATGCTFSSSDNTALSSIALKPYVEAGGWTAISAIAQYMARKLRTR